MYGLGMVTLGNNRGLGMTQKGVGVMQKGLGVALFPYTQSIYYSQVSSYINYCVTD